MDIKEETFSTFHTFRLLKETTQHVATLHFLNTDSYGAEHVRYWQAV